MERLRKQLHETKLQVERKKHVSLMVRDLTEQKKILEEKLTDLQKILQKERADVERFERKSLSAFFYALIGKKEERLDKERQEAYAAELKYALAEKELVAICTDIEKYTAELSALQGCEDAYKRIFREKRAWLKTSEVYAREIVRIEEKIAQTENQIRELSEAIEAGEKVGATLDETLAILKKAETCGKWDMWTDGGFANIAKYKKLDEAQRAIEDLQVDIRRFKTEMVDVQIQADIQVDIKGFLRFADWFFDNIFLEWAVLERIQASQTQLREIKGTVTEAVEKLSRLRDLAEESKRDSTQTLNELILNA